MRTIYMQMLEDTLQILENGCYSKNGKMRRLKLTPEQMRECYVFLPEKIRDICNQKGFAHVCATEKMEVSCRNIDSFSMALEEEKQIRLLGRKDRVLVLNFANPVHPGGGVRGGARAQEEDLCRKSSLLLSLESERAREYYSYNWNSCSYMGSDAIILTPHVEMIKDCKGELLEESVVVSVMTCAAPMVMDGLGYMTEEEYRALFYRRICGMLKCAAYWGYQVFVLGAFGCGAFKNDAKLVSDLFYRALKEFEYDGMEAKDFFRRIDFAVLDRSPTQYNFREFSRNFENFYREVEK